MKRIGTLIRRLPASMRQLSRQARIAILASIGAIFCVLVVLFILFMRLMAHEQSPPPAPVASRPVTTHQAADQHPDQVQQLSRQIDTVLQQQNSLQQQQSRLAQQLQQLQQTIPAEAVSKQSSQIQAVQSRLKQLAESQSESRSQVNTYLNKLDQKLATITKQVQAGQSSTGLPKVTNSAFRLTSIIWVDNQPKAVVFVPAEQANKMLSIGETYQGWQVQTIHDRCVRFMRADHQGVNQQCV